MELGSEARISTVDTLIRRQPEIAGLQAYEYFRNNNASHKADFITSTGDLDLTYPELTEDRIASLAKGSMAALKELMPEETTLKKETLFRAIEYRYCELYLLDTARMMNDRTLDAQERNNAMVRFKEASEALYGLPELGKFNSLADQSFSAVLVDDGTNTKIKAELATRLGNIGPERTTPFVADQETVNRVHDLVIERFSGLIEHVDSEKVYGVSEITTVLREALEKTGAQALGWNVEVIPDASALSVSAHQKLVEVGENRKELTGNVLQGLILHEIGVHVQRSVNAERAGYTAAAYGMDGYLDFEEALGSALEAAFAGKFADKGIDYYLIAGLAYGMDNHSPRAFREVYDIMWRRGALKAAQRNELSPAQIDKAKSAAFTNCMRMFRGTDTKTPGVIYLKDLSYSRGKELVWSQLAKVTNQEEFAIFFAGKVDLTQPDHFAVAKEIIASQA